MEKKLLSRARLIVAVGLVAAAAAAQVQAQQAPGAPTTATTGPGQPGSPPIPSTAEGTAVAVEGGGYCYVGPHPVDTRAAAGPPWDAAQGRHIHTYPPFDLRLFALRDGCYYFIGDPRDFGYQGDVYNYYGAHPVHDHHGGGWCFMIGGHAHSWSPFSPNFVVMGPWYYWYGPYDSYFWAYWPYYSFYYRSHYPHYYGGGRYWRHRGREVVVAPPITRVPNPTPAEHWRGAPPPRAPAAPGAFTNGPGDLGREMGRGQWRGAPPAAPSPPGAPVQRVDTWSRPPAWGGVSGGSPYGAAPAPAYRTTNPRLSAPPAGSLRGGGSFRGSPTPAAPAGSSGRGPWRR